MNKGRLLWILVLADLFLSFASVGSEAFFGWTMPAALTTWRKDSGFSIHGIGDVLGLMLLSSTCLVAFAAWAGLVSYWRHARELYVVACALWLLEVLFDGPAVMPSVSLVFRLLNAMVGGFIIALVYFTDLARRFESRTAPNGAAAAASRV